MMKIAAIALSLLISLTACSDSAEEPSAQPAPDSPVSTLIPPGPGEPIEPSPSPVEPTPGLQDVHPIMWQDATVGSDDRTVTLNFYTGVPDCYGLDRVDVDYNPGTIRITLYQGNVAGAEVCPEIAVFASTTVTLDEPVAGRGIADGANGPTPTPATD